MYAAKLFTYLLQVLLVFSDVILLFLVNSGSNALPCIEACITTITLVVLVFYYLYFNHRVQVTHKMRFHQTCTPGVCLQVAIRCGVPADAVKNVIIWGNHSSTQYPDVHHTKVTVQGTEMAAYDAIKDDAWLKGDFISVSGKKPF